MTKGSLYILNDGFFLLEQFSMRQRVVNGAKYALDMYSVSSGPKQVYDLPVYPICPL